MGTISELKCLVEKNVQIKYNFIGSFQGTNDIREMRYPKVQKYCLMSVKGCYTGKKHPAITPLTLSQLKKIFSFAWHDKVTYGKASFLLGGVKIFILGDCQVPTVCWYFSCDSQRPSHFHERQWQHIYWKDKIKDTSSYLVIGGKEYIGTVWEPLQN